MNIIATYIAELASLCDRSAAPSNRDRLCGDLQEVFNRLAKAAEEGLVSDESLTLGTVMVEGLPRMRKIIQSPNYRFSVMCRDATDAFSGLDFVIYTTEHTVHQRYKISPPLIR